MIRAGGKKGKKRGTALESVIPVDYYDLSWGTNGEGSGLGSTSEIPRVSVWASEALKNEDVLQLIFDHFDLQPGSPSAAQTRRDLLSAARTCKAFAEPALNSLWRVLPSLLPLLLLLPSAEIVNNKYFADNIPVSSNWERFEKHARQVRTLYMETPRVFISSMIYLRIRDMYEGPLLPGLKAIHVPNDDAIDLHSAMFLVLGAPLDVVELNNSALSERNFFIPFMTSLASKSPHLSHLSLRGTGNVSLEPVYRLTSLQRLEIRLSGTYLYPQTLRRLGNLVNLVDLTLDVGSPIPVPTIDPRVPAFPSSYRPFGRVKRLHITGILSSITRVLDDVDLTGLTALVIEEIFDGSGTQTESFWRRCLDQVSVCRGMEDIEINQINHRPWGHDRYSLSASWLHSLSNLDNVKNLVINGSALSGSDNDFRVLAGIFPKLKKVVVPPVYFSQGRTLACLFYFAQGCPDLQEISICLSSDVLSNVNAINKLPPISVNHHHPLEKLYINSQFGQMQPIHMIPVAQFLNFLFPNLSILETYGSNSTEASIWMGVQMARVALQSAMIHGVNRARLGIEMDMES